MKRALRVDGRAILEWLLNNIRKNMKLIYRCQNRVQLHNNKVPAFIKDCECIESVVT
jgi:hypothetical protein